MGNKVGGIIKRIYPNSKVSSIKRFPKGLINETYSFKADNQELVFRAYPQDFWKVKKEQYLYDLIMKKTDVPVPDVIKAGRNYIILARVDGKELPLNNKTLIKKAGESLANIHSIKFPYYGWIVGDKIMPRFKNWVDFINYDIDSKFKKIPKKERWLKNEIKKIINKDSSLLDIGSKACLLHKDYHTSHILADKNKIKGIIDIEWAIAGHNELDLAKSCLWMFNKKPKLEEIFLQGYNRYGKISKEFSKRKKIYRILILFSSLSMSYGCKNKKWSAYNLKQLKGELNEYHKNN